MVTASEKDDSLDEIHSELLSFYHKRLGFLAWLTGSAIIFSLGLVYFNQVCRLIPWWVILVVAIVDIATIILGLVFVVSIIDPKKYRKTAEKILVSSSEKTQDITNQQPASVFFDAFRDLEIFVRKYLKESDLYVPSRGTPQMSYSFRQMIDALYRSGKIDHEKYEDLLEINRYRNLVFHGHEVFVTNTMVSRVKNAKENLIKSN